jgi:hypothetical protein
MFPVSCADRGCGIKQGTNVGHQICRLLLYFPLNNLTSSHPYCVRRGVPDCFREWSVRMVTRMEGMVEQLASCAGQRAI